MCAGELQSEVKEDKSTQQSGEMNTWKKTEQLSVLTLSMEVSSISMERGGTRRGARDIPSLTLPRDGPSLRSLRFLLVPGSGSQVGALMMQKVVLLPLVVTTATSARSITRTVSHQLVHVIHSTPSLVGGLQLGPGCGLAN